MAQLLDIQKVVVGPETLRATVRVAEGAPLRTSENVEGTARVYWLMPEIADHVCLGAGGSSFKDVMGDTDVAHLMEHVTLELLARTNLGGDLSNARTHTLEVPRTYEIELACPDDVLVTACLSSAGWILQWAYGSADEATKPNVDAIVAGIMNLVARSYEMEGNEAPMPGTVPEAVEVAEDEVVERGFDGTLVENARVAVGAEPGADVSVADAGVRLDDDLVEPEVLAEERFEADADAVDELADYDLVMGNDEAEDVIESLDVEVSGRSEPPRVTRIDGTVGFMDLADDDPLAGDIE